MIMFLVVFVVFYQCVLVVYIEVGLCIGNIYLLWLEEMNWCMVFEIVSLYFVFIRVVYDNLVCEGINFFWIVMIGNIGIDVLKILVQCLNDDVIFWLGVEVIFVEMGVVLDDWLKVFIMGYWWESFG